MWWLSKFSLLVTEKCERNSKSSGRKTLHVMSPSGLGRACASPQQSSRGTKDMRDVSLSLGTPSCAPQARAAVAWGQTRGEWDLLPDWAHLSPHQGYFLSHSFSKCPPLAGSSTPSSCWSMFLLGFWTCCTGVVRFYLGQLCKKIAMGISTSGTLPDQFLILSYFISSHLT